MERKKKHCRGNRRKERVKYREKEKRGRRMNKYGGKERE